MSGFAVVRKIHHRASAGRRERDGRHRRHSPGGGTATADPADPDPFDKAVEYLVGQGIPQTEAEVNLSLLLHVIASRQG